VLIDFFLTLKSHRLPVSIKEYLTLLEALERGVIGPSVEQFYYLARATLVKDESNYDKFDRAFSEFWQGVETIPGIEAEVPLEWLRKQAELVLTEEAKRRIAARGGWEALMETLKKRLAEQSRRHQGGSKWIGTAGTSPFGAWGYNPEGIRIGQERGRNRGAVKVWEAREYRNLDDSVELGTRNLKVALRRLRKFAREGAAEEFDLEGTIQSTAKRTWLDVQMRPERRNTIKVLMFMDIGGTMDEHVRVAEELFSAAKSEFKRLEFFYFHNCLYDFVWRDNRRRHSERTRTWDILHRYPQDYRVIFVGDATMSPYEILQPGGSVEYFNEEPGAVWLKRMTDTYPKCVWLNPEPEQVWGYRQSIGIIRELMKDRMYPTTVAGIEQAMKVLAK
jgi:uncharacterized protein with von Willebrand factor type A (vWA) domain